MITFCSSDFNRYTSYQTQQKESRGVFTPLPISSGTIIDISPVLLLSPEENNEHVEKTCLYHYTYNWPTPAYSGHNQTQTAAVQQAVVFGLGSMFNHSQRNQNVGWKRDLARQVIVYRALRDIQAGEELCISYGDRLTFSDADGDVETLRKQDATQAETAEELLGRIDLDAT